MCHIKMGEVRTVSPYLLHCSDSEDLSMDLQICRTPRHISVFVVVECYWAPSDLMLTPYSFQTLHPTPYSSFQVDSLNATYSLELGIAWQGRTYLYDAVARGLTGAARSTPRFVRYLANLPSLDSSDFALFLEHEPLTALVLSEVWVCCWDRCIDVLTMNVWLTVVQHFLCELHFARANWVVFHLSWFSFGSFLAVVRCRPMLRLSLHRLLAMKELCGVAFSLAVVSTHAGDIESSWITWMSPGAGFRRLGATSCTCRQMTFEWTSFV